MPNKLPAMMFYTGDWMKSPDVRMCSFAARGLWFDMLCLMHESARRGYLQQPNGKPLTLDQLTRMTGGSTDEVTRLLQELDNSGVFSRTDHGVIYSRRVLRDEKIRSDRSAAGKKGGNPNLVKQKDKPPDNGVVKDTDNHPLEDEIEESEKGELGETFDEIDSKINAFLGDNVGLAMNCGPVQRAKVRTMIAAVGWPDTEKALKEAIENHAANPTAYAATIVSNRQASKPAQRKSITEVKTYGH